jgi:ribA/ribD-fused uncharacterized protein
MVLLSLLGQDTYRVWVGACAGKYLWGGGGYTGMRGTARNHCSQPIAGSEVASTKRSRNKGKDEADIKQERMPKKSKSSAPLSKSSSSSSQSASATCGTGVSAGSSTEKLYVPKVLGFQSNSAEIERSIFPANAGKLLSNFADLDVCLRSLTFPTAEHAFQGMKYTFTARPEMLTEFALGGSIGSAADAKKAGSRGGMTARGVELDLVAWDANRVAVMNEIILSKISRHEVIREILGLARDHRVLLVHTSRSDLDWGAHLNEEKTGIKRGNNLLGNIYNTIELP